MLLSLSANAQTLSHTNDPEAYIYCEIVGHYKFMSRKLTIELDLGQAAALFNPQKLSDGSGKEIVFNSMVDAMNHMRKWGWEFVQAYVVINDDVPMHRWILKKRRRLLTEYEEALLSDSYDTPDSAQ